MDSIEAGSVVQIKSGGPAMTVTKVDGSNVQCLWFGETADDVRTATVPAIALVMVNLEEENADEDDED